MIELKYGNTNTYLIKGDEKYLLFDTDWAGTFGMFCKALKEKNVKLQDIEYLVISHFHPDHMGIAGEIARAGVKIVVADVQKEFVHFADAIFEKDGVKSFVPIDSTMTVEISVSESRQFLRNIGIEGEIIYTPGHSDDSISIMLDDGALFVGDLNPLYELELHEGTVIGDSWERLLALKPSRVFYGHAKTAILGDNEKICTQETDEQEKYKLVSDTSER